MPKFTLIRQIIALDPLEHSTQRTQFSHNKSIHET